ncbi:hypothetical protein ACLKA7_001301 [Drosophila subpalustris]
MFATPIASMDVDVPIVDAVPTDTASSPPLSDSSAVVKKRTSRPKPNKAPPPVIVTAGSSVSLEATGDSTPAILPVVPSSAAQALEHELVTIMSKPPRQQPTPTTDQPSNPIIATLLNIGRSILMTNP